MTEAQELLAEVVAEVDEPSRTATEAAQLAEFDRRLRELEAAVGDLRTVSAVALTRPASAGRKTLPAQTEMLLSKHGVSAEVQAASLDGALSSLSIEQRIAVKSQMLRAGLL